MFDSVYTACPACSDHEVEIQFKVYLGKYSPDCQIAKLGEVLEGFPKIPYLVETGDFKCGETYCEAVIEFRHGVLTKVVHPIPKDFQHPQLPSGRNTDRKEALARVRQKQIDEECGGKSFGEIYGSFLGRMMGSPGFARSVFKVSDIRYKNYVKENGKWRRA